MSLFDVKLGAASLSALSDKIIVRDIVEEPYEEEIYKAPKAYSPGQRVSKKVRRSLSVRVVFVVRERNPQKRAEILNSIASWAVSDTTLEVNYRTVTKVTDSGYTYTEGRQLSRVVLTEPPALDSANKWTQDLSMTFTAFDVPYWEDLSRYGYSFSASTLDVMNRYSYSGTIYNNGTAPETPVEMQITNDDSSSVLQSMNIRVGDYRFYLEELDVDPGYELIIEYDDDTGVLVINRIATTGSKASRLSCRTADSNDELIAQPGANSVQITANVPVSGYIYVRGRYL